MKKTCEPTKPKHPKAVVQDALQTTFVLKGTLKRAQLMYLQVGALLVKVRDLKLYEALNHPDMETYARERLGLGRSSLYNYLRIRDWVGHSHPEWIQPKAKGFIPDLTDVGDLMWIEAELAKPKISSARRATLKALQAKGLAGKLTRSEVNKIREPGNTARGGFRQMVTKLRDLRRRAAELASMSPEVLAHLDAAIQILANDETIKVARLPPLELAPDEKWRGNFMA